jgi:hypothetical protein
VHICKGSSHPLIGFEPALGISAKVAKGVIRDWMCRKHEEHWESIHGQRQAKGFFKKPSAKKKVCELLNLSRNQLRILTWLLTGHCHLKGHVFNLGLVNRPKRDRCEQTTETASHILRDCEALTTLRFRHLGHHFRKPGDSEDMAAQKIGYGRSA